MSCTPVTVTVCAVLQFVPEKVSVDGATVPSLASRLETDTVTFCEDAALSRTGNVAWPPPSFAWPDTAPVHRPFVLSVCTGIV